jgi:diaminopimelate decarboxylase
VPGPDRLPAIADALRLAARRFGTPVYVTDLTSLATAAATVSEAFPDPWLRHYSLKANDVPAIVAAIAAHGFGANVVSRGEWDLARRAGVPNGRITLEGVGKTDADLRAAVRASAGRDPLRWVAVESPDELAVLERLAERAGLGVGDRPPLDVLLRLNPAVMPETHDGLAVGRAASKFGMTETELTAAAEGIGGGVPRRAARIRGVHLHVGSQLGAVDAWRDAMRRALAVIALVRPALPHFDTLDVGGGFPVTSPDAASPAPERFAREVPALLDVVPEERRPTRFGVEPGRALVARAGWLLARVLHSRDRDRPLVVLDAGMTELIRPALYGARHEIVALTSHGRARDVGRWSARADAVSTRVEGPVCESTDALGEHRLPPLRRGDIVAIRDAGAYAASQASAYNGRPRPPQLLLEADGRLVVARRRGTLASLA